MTDLEIEELERKATGSNSDIVEEVRSVDALPGHVGRREKCFVGNEQADSLDEEEVATVMEVA